MFYFLTLLTGTTFTGIKKKFLYSTFLVQIGKLMLAPAAVMWLLFSLPPCSICQPSSSASLVSPSGST